MHAIWHGPLHARAAPRPSRRLCVIEATETNNHRPYPTRQCSPSPDGPAVHNVLALAPFVFGPNLAPSNNRPPLFFLCTLSVVAFSCFHIAARAAAHAPSKRAGPDGEHLCPPQARGRPVWEKNCGGAALTAASAQTATSTCFHPPLGRGASKDGAATPHFTKCSLPRPWPARSWRRWHGAAKKPRSYEILSFARVMPLCSVGLDCSTGQGVRCGE